MLATLSHYCDIKHTCIKLQYGSLSPGRTAGSMKHTEDLEVVALLLTMHTHTQLSLLPFIYLNNITLLIPCYQTLSLVCEHCLPS
jgi:hypothetical protein